MLLLRTPSRLLHPFGQLSHPVHVDWVIDLMNAFSEKYGEAVILLQKPDEFPVCSTCWLVKSVVKKDSYGILLTELLISYPTYTNLHEISKIIDGKEQTLCKQ